jgi:hypothetical protein
MAAQCSWQAAWWKSGELTPLLLQLLLLLSLHQRVAALAGAAGFPMHSLDLPDA